ATWSAAIRSAPRSRTASPSCSRTRSRHAHGEVARSVAGGPSLFSEPSFPESPQEGQEDRVPTARPALPGAAPAARSGQGDRPPARLRLPLAPRAGLARGPLLPGGAAARPVEV